MSRSSMLPPAPSHALSIFGSSSSSPLLFSHHPPASPPSPLSPAAGDCDLLPGPELDDVHGGCPAERVHHRLPAGQHGPSHRLQGGLCRPHAGLPGGAAHLGAAGGGEGGCVGRGQGSGCIMHGGGGQGGEAKACVCLFFCDIFLLFSVAGSLLIRFARGRQKYTFLLRHYSDVLDCPELYFPSEWWGDRLCVQAITPACGREVASLCPSMHAWPPPHIKAYMAPPPRQGIHGHTPTSRHTWPPTHIKAYMATRPHQGIHGHTHPSRHTWPHPHIKAGMATPPHQGIHGHTHTSRHMHAWAWSTKGFVVSAACPAAPRHVPPVTDAWPCPPLCLMPGHAPPCSGAAAVLQSCQFSAGGKLVKVWQTILKPHILYPALFIFLWQVQGQGKSGEVSVSVSVCFCGV